MCQTADIATINVPIDASTKDPPEIGSLNDPVGEIAQFLAKEIFTVDPDMEEMKTCGQQLFQIGFRTKDMLVSNVKVEDVGEWRWMRMYHKDCFEEWMHNKA